ncbi:hypothetical protein SAY86_001203 [Trapa natans]|uniref:Uncharacterized protein n=1 Tax=Trapa natans TaxID=22666 RepID=A0AAN7RHD7_TRANT|nr:hypothetical protein SAY86_001203 [Trapa natans]
MPSNNGGGKTNPYAQGQQAVQWMYPQMQWMGDVQYPAAAAAAAAIAMQQQQQLMMYSQQPYMPYHNYQQFPHHYPHQQQKGFHHQQPQHSKPMQQNGSSGDINGGECKSYTEQTNWPIRRPWYCPVDMGINQMGLLQRVPSHTTTRITLLKSAEDAIQELNGTLVGKQSVRLSWGRSPANKQRRNEGNSNQWNGSHYTGQSYGGHGNGNSGMPNQQDADVANGSS